VTIVQTSIQGILFDKDGTLLDYHATWMPLNRQAALMVAGGEAAVAERLLVETGYDPASGRCLPDTLLASATNDEIGAAWAGMLGLDPAETAARVTATFEAMSGETAVPVARLAETVAALKARGLVLGVATNDSEDSAYGSLEPFGVLDHFSYVVGYDSGHGGKPGPGMVAGFCAATGLEAASVAVVGDSLHDLEMGRRAGAGLLVGVLTGTSLREHLAPHAHHVIESIAELEALLDAEAERKRA